MLTTGKVYKYNEITSGKKGFLEVEKKRICINIYRKGIRYVFNNTRNIHARFSCQNGRLVFYADCQLRSYLQLFLKGIRILVSFLRAFVFWYQSGRLTSFD
jgi:hypothetical protein